MRLTSCVLRSVWWLLLQLICQRATLFYHFGFIDDARIPSETHTSHCYYIQLICQRATLFYHFAFIDNDARIPS